MPDSPNWHSVERAFAGPPPTRPCSSDRRCPTGTTVCADPRHRVGFALGWDILLAGRRRRTQPTSNGDGHQWSTNKQSNCTSRGCNACQGVPVPFAVLVQGRPVTPKCPPGGYTAKGVLRPGSGTPSCRSPAKTPVLHRLCKWKSSTHPDKVWTMQHHPYASNTRPEGEAPQCRSTRS